ncbi:pilus assembly protein N-terminal domain-containing protein [Brucella anthropi]|uniref:pilus assembly protein N-terminal domain-containing protein n=1 Tax=Brucella anthropi TaxID=529 RepID=UPI00384B7B08
MKHKMLSLYVMYISLLLIVFILISMRDSFAQQQPLIVEIGKGMQLERAVDAESIFVADPLVADISSSSNKAYFIYGKTIGETTITATDFSGKRIFHYNIRVIHNLSDLNRTINARFGNGFVVKSSRGSVLVSGIASDVRTKKNLLDSISKALPSELVIDEVIVEQSSTVELRVQLIEVARSQLERFGVNWSALVGSDFSDERSTVENAQKIGKILNLLKDKGVATILSESTLASTTNKKAVYSVGDEIAIPSVVVGEADSSKIQNVDYRFTGLKVTFEPVMVPANRVSLSIDAEMSNVQTYTRFPDGSNIPNVTSRRVSSNVELSSEQSFILASLSQLDTSAILETPVGVGIVGNIVRSITGFEHIRSGRKDLLIVVTPKFGKSQYSKQLQNIDKPRSNLEYILSNKRGIRKNDTHADLSFMGASGFLY